MSYIFTHATLLDGTRDMQPQPNMTVAVDDAGRISAVGPAATTVGAAGAQEIDLAGAYLMPGLVNRQADQRWRGRRFDRQGGGQSPWPVVSASHAAQKRPAAVGKRSHHGAQRGRSGVCRRVGA